MATSKGYTINYGTLADKVHVQIVAQDTTVDFYLSREDTEFMIVWLKAQIKKLDQEKP